MLSFYADDVILFQKVNVKNKNLHKSKIRVNAMQNNVTQQKRFLKILIIKLIQEQLKWILLLK